MLADKPAHGWSLVRSLRPGGDVGRVWSSSRPLVYRTLETLSDRRLVRITKSERSPTGPARSIFAPTAAGRRAVERWLATPVEHVREIRAELMIKLLLHDRAGTSPQELLDRQAEV